jgi:hypothetical protein
LGDISRDIWEYTCEPTSTQGTHISDTENLRVNLT